MTLAEEYRAAAYKTLNEIVTQKLPHNVKPDGYTNVGGIEYAYWTVPDMKVNNREVIVLEDGHAHVWGTWYTKERAFIRTRTVWHSGWCVVGEKTGGTTLDESPSGHTVRLPTDKLDDIGYWLNTLS